MQAEGAPDGDDQGHGAPVSQSEESNLIIFIPDVKHEYAFCDSKHISYGSYARMNLWFRP